MEWILAQIERTIEQDSNPNAVYIIDYLPNLKYLLRIQDITKECAKALAKFEERVGKEEGENKNKGETVNICINT